MSNSECDLNSRDTAKQLLAMELASYIFAQSEKLMKHSLHAKAIADTEGGQITQDELVNVIRMASNYAATTVVLGIDIYIDPTNSLS